LTKTNAFRILSVRTYSTVEVAKLLDIGNDTLHRWVHTKKVTAPELQRVGGLSIRLWTEADIEAVREYKARHYWGRGTRRPKKKKR
jgi:excisionase family DNA binding protein